MQKLEPSMTRTAFCKNCENAGYPRKQTAYAVYAGSHKSYSLYLHVGDVKKRDLGITPHIFFDTFLVIPTGNKDGDHYCVTKCLCGVIGCGFNIKWNKEHEVWCLFPTHEPDFTYIKGASMKALRDFKDPSMHLNVVDAESWKIHDIVKKQQEFFKSLRYAQMTR
jgi:hypothetical protein